MTRDAAGQALPSLNGYVGEVWIDLDQTRAPACPLRRNERGTGSAERIEDDSAAVGTVADRVGDQGDRLGGRVERQFALRRSVQRVLTDIVPNVGPVPAMPPEGHIVDVRVLTDLEDKYELMLGTIQRAHAGIGLIPNA